MDAWLARQAELLAKEQEEGKLRHRPEAVGKLRLSHSKIGAFGKATLVLHRDNALPVDSFAVGTPVRLACARWGEDKQGLVTRIVADDELEVSCKEGEEPSFAHDITMTTLPDETTLKRVNKALAKAANSRFAAILFANQQPRFGPPRATTTESTLNPAQQLALDRGLGAKDVCVIWGPPGTGKTHTLAQLLQALLRQDESNRILCVAPSNVAVDNLLAALLKDKRVPRQSLVRIGHPARVDQGLHAYTLDSILASSDEAALVQSAKDELASTKDKQLKTALRREIKTRERRLVRELFSSRCRIVFSTIASSAKLEKLLPQGFAYSHLVVDECGQAMESSVWVPLQFLHPQTGVLVLAGDHKQLPPTVLSQEAALGGLSSTMMDRLMATQRECSVMLLEQYRMCESIMAWSGREMYDNRLVAHESVRGRRLADLASDKADDDDAALFGPLLLIDTAGCDMAESSGGGEDASRTNPGEVELVVAHVARLMGFGLSAAQIAVISPYKAQVNLLKERLPHIEVRSVDGFQGQERDAVVISLVRSNRERNVGFLQDERRMNVAITRAKRHVCVVGDSSTLEQDRMLASLLAHFELAGEVRSAVDFPVDYVKVAKTTTKTARVVAAAKPKATKPAEVKPAVVAAAPPKRPATLSLPMKATTTTTKFPGFAKLNHDDDDDDSSEEEEAPVPAKTLTKTPTTPAQPKAEEEDDEDAFLDALVQRANNCVFAGCQTKTTMVGHDCSFCKQRYCLKHRQPEAHGCGKQAKKTAMQANYSKAPPLKQADRAKLQAKLKDKLAKDEAGRSAKPKPKAVN